MNIHKYRKTLTFIYIDSEANGIFLFLHKHNAFLFIMFIVQTLCNCLHFCVQYTEFEFHFMSFKFRLLLAFVVEHNMMLTDCMFINQAFVDIYFFNFKLKYKSGVAMICIQSFKVQLQLRSICQQTCALFTLYSFKKKIFFLISGTWSEVIKANGMVDLTWPWAFDDLIHSSDHVSPTLWQIRKKEMTNVGSILLSRPLKIWS